MADDLLVVRRTTLTSLPREVISHLSYYLDVRSVVNLARVSRAFTHLLSSYRLWDFLVLSLPRHYGETPSIVPRFPNEERREAWVRARDREVEEVCRLALKEKLRTVVCRGDERNWAKVKSIELDPRPGTLLGMTHILELSSASLQALRIRNRPPYPALSDLMTLDVKLLDARIDFPSLVMIHIGGAVNCPAPLLPVLCNSAPNLTSVNVTFSRSGSAAWENAIVPKTIPYTRPTLITNVRFAMTACRDRWQDGVIKTLLEFLAACPLVRQLSLPHDGLEEGCIRRMMGGIAAHPSLEDLYWPIDLMSWADALEDTHATCPKLRRVVLACLRASSGIELLNGNLGTGVLEELYIDASSLETSRGKRNHVALSAQSMTPRFASHLRAHPRLRIIHTLHKPIDRHDDTSTSLFKRLDNLAFDRHKFGRVSSVMHKGRELVHVRLGTHLMETEDKPLPAVSVYRQPHLYYKKRDNSRWCKLYSETRSAVWADYTHYDGLPVPLEVIEKMREVAGMSRSKWRRRGVKADRETWAVLEEWHQGELREQKRIQQEQEEEEEEEEELEEDEHGYEYDEEHEGCSDPGCTIGDCNGSGGGGYDYEPAPVRGQNGARWDSYSQSMVWGVGVRGD